MTTLIWFMYPVLVKIVCVYCIHHLSMFFCRFVCFLKYQCLTQFSLASADSGPASLSFMEARDMKKGELMELTTWHTLEWWKGWPLHLLCIFLRLKVSLLIIYIYHLIHPSSTSQSTLLQGTTSNFQIQPSPSRTRRIDETFVVVSLVSLWY